MHSFLITGGTDNQRQQEIEKLQRAWRVIPVDQTTLQKDEEKNSIGIDEVRSFQRQLQLRPIGSPVRVGVIYDIDALTIEAQQCLLKTLEEPPSSCRIILTGVHAQSLFPTVISRCQHHDLPGQPATDPTKSAAWLKELSTLRSFSYGARIATVETLAKTRESAAAWTKQSILYARTTVLDAIKHDLSTPVHLPLLLRTLLKAERELSANCNPKLVLGNVLLSLA